MDNFYIIIMNIIFFYSNFKKEKKSYYFYHIKLSNVLEAMTCSTPLLIHVWTEGVFDNLIYTPDHIVIICMDSFHFTLCIMVTKLCAYKNCWLELPKPMSRNSSRDHRLDSKPSSKLVCMWKAWDQLPKLGDPPSPGILNCFAAYQWIWRNGYGDPLPSRIEASQCWSRRECCLRKSSTGAILLARCLLHLVALNPRAVWWKFWSARTSICAVDLCTSLSWSRVLQHQPSLISSLGLEGRNMGIETIFPAANNW